MALVVLSVVEQRLDAVRAVLAGAQVGEVAAQAGVHRTTVQRWVGRYLSDRIGGLADRSHRPLSCPHQAGEAVEVAVAEMRRQHPRWGSRRIRLELLREPLPWSQESIVVPSERTIDRILIRHGLLRQRKARRSRESFIRFERPGPMQLWGIDIVGGIELVNPVTGQLREAKIVTGVDDHSRFCVMAAVVERATGRAVCVAFAQALVRFGVPEEVITDNGKQFTDRFNRYRPSRGEVLFDKICRRNGITHRLTVPASPNQNGKVERFHGTFRPEISQAGPFESLAAAQTAVDTWVEHYNRDRPHQGLDPKKPVVPADRFAPTHPPGGLELWVPPALEGVEPVSEPVVEPVVGREPGGPVELDRPVPASGNMALCGNQFWLGPARAGQVVRFWIDCEWVHLSVAGQRVKSLRSRFSVSDLAILLAQGAVPAGPTPLASRGGPGAGRTARSSRWSGPWQERQRVAGQPDGAGRGDPRRPPGRDLYRGRRPLLFFDPDTRELLRSRPNPLEPGEAARLQQARPVGPVPRPSTEPVTVQRRASNSGVIMVAGQKVALGRGTRIRP